MLTHETQIENAWFGEGCTVRPPDHTRGGDVRGISDYSRRQNKLQRLWLA